MDPICHTLTGAALGEAGLKRKTAYGLPLLLVAANLPDIDVAAYLWSPEHALDFRRGLTHGVLALALWPIIIAMGLLLLKSIWGRLERVDLGWAMGLTAIGVVSHPLLDWLNVYGIRLLAPFSDKWFYGDTLFIVDPWIWLMLGVGAVLSRRRRSGRPAMAAMALVAVYSVAMMGISRSMAASVAAELSSAANAAPRVMTAPVAVNPLARWVVADTGGGYVAGRARFPLRSFEPYRGPELAVEPGPYAARVLERDPVVRFLGWARFPYFEELVVSGKRTVWVADARYGVDASATWAAVRITWEGDP